MDYIKKRENNNKKMFLYIEITNNNNFQITILDLLFNIKIVQFYFKLIDITIITVRFILQIVIKY